MATFTLTNGYVPGQYGTVAGYGITTPIHGSLSPTTITGDSFSSDTILILRWSDYGWLSLWIGGNHAEDDISSLVIGGTTYPVGDITDFSANNSGAPNYSGTYSAWQWTVGQSNPFGTTDGTQIAVTINTAAGGPVTIPAYGGDIANQTIAYDHTGDLAVSVILNSGADSGEEAFKISTTSSINNVIATTAPYYTGSTITVPAANLPSQGDTSTYTIFAYRYASADPPGDETYRLINSFTIEREVAPSTGGGGDTNPDSAYGVQVFDSSSNLTLDITDSVAFFKATGTLAVVGTGTTDISVPGVTTLDYAFTTETFASTTYGGIQGYVIRASIPSNGTVRISATAVGSPGNVTINYVVISLGDQ